jgi:CubicO group peptidase (beta-lactamase class C family)
MQSSVQESLLDNATALSLAVASVYEDQPFLNQSYSPLVYNSTGAHMVDGDIVFRIGSVSKVFTVMGLLLLGNKINWADPITKYVPELNRLKSQQDPQSVVTTVEWDLVSIDALASQLAGVGYDCECLCIDSDEYRMLNIEIYISGQRSWK